MAPTTRASSRATKDKSGLIGAPKISKSAPKSKSKAAVMGPQAQDMASKSVLEPGIMPSIEAQPGPIEPEAGSEMDVSSPQEPATAEKSRGRYSLSPFDIPWACPYNSDNEGFVAPPCQPVVYRQRCIKCKKNLPLAEFELRKNMAEHKKKCVKCTQALELKKAEKSTN